MEVLDIIYTIDVIDYNTIENRRLKEYIDREGKLIFLTNGKGELLFNMNKINDKVSDHTYDERSAYKIFNNIKKNYMDLFDKSILNMESEIGNM
ncbi:hypothetical protein [Dethiothermospora halolimnae]|uniref:hypothetical protein n=1 Tax=Dethiothermospora halolimnae TaxID=3114390 RepID=UPI003CCB752C